MTKPIILLIGGATGTGKSTVATEVAYRLGINRVTSTDVVRQTLRAFFAEEYLPSIHRSSFDAGPGETMVDGFLDQTTNVLIAVEASIERALQEGWSMVLEGVHLVPGMLSVRQGRRDRRPLRALDSRTRRRTRRTSGSATQRRTASGRWRSTSIGSTTSGGFRSSSSSARGKRTYR